MNNPCTINGMAETIPRTTSNDIPVGMLDTDIVPYEQQLSTNTEWALNEGSLFFEGGGRVHESLRRIVKRLDELGIPYAVAGGMALFVHGYRRFTEDVDVLVTREGLERIHKELEGRGYRRPFEKSKNLRDAESGVKIEFLVTGGYPGDGKPKSIQFPEPGSVAELRDGYQVLNIPQLISLKIASGITGEGRTRDIGDVEELIKLLDLPESFSDSLHPFAHEKYVEIWRKLHAGTKRFLRLWRNKWLTANARTIDDMIIAFGAAADELKAMRDDGAVLDPEGGTADDYAYLVTTDPAVAKKYGMEDETEFWGLDDDLSSDDEAADKGK
jgi:hypothetical protein